MYVQARAIHELANKVFHVLKTNPENFASEFSGTRRRSMRKALRDDSIAKSGVCPSASAFRTSNGKGPAAFHFNGSFHLAALVVIVTQYIYIFLIVVVVKHTGSGDGRVADRRDAYLRNKEDHPQTYNSSSRAQLVLVTRFHADK